MLINPKIGDVIVATAGLRKLRRKLKGKGKRGGIRILYLDIEEYGIIYFITNIKKNEKENLTDKDKKLTNNKISKIKDILKQK